MPSARSHASRFRQRFTAQVSLRKGTGQAEPSLKQSRGAKQSISTEDVLSVLKYFGYFSYPLSAEEIWYFMPVKCTYAETREMIDKLVKSTRVQDVTNRGQYALGGHSISKNNRNLGAQHTTRILKKSNKFLYTVSLMPWIELVGVSGSCAMDNATSLDDLDVFIVSAPGCIWLSRLTAIICAKIFGKHRSYADVEKSQTAHKICLNLFFDAKYVVVPSERQSLYTAHEVVQMRPVKIRGGAYERFMLANSWVQSYFPNISIRKQIQNCGRVTRMDGARILPEKSLGGRGVGCGVVAVLEWCSKWFQLKLMHTPTSETITDEQLWFFPHDFSERLRSKMPL